MQRYEGAIETPLKGVALAIERLVKLTASPFIIFARNGDTNAPTTQIAANLATAVVLDRKG
jgi:hypothetical protein